jgi:hypothetical protein
VSGEVEMLGHPPPRALGARGTRLGSWGRGSSMAATHWGTRWPWRHFVDYVAGSKVDRLELLIGPATGQIWIWANYESCSFRDALQFLFKDPDQRSNGLGSN